VLGRRAAENVASAFLMPPRKANYDASSIDVVQKCQAASSFSRSGEQNDQLAAYGFAHHRVLPT
jgi:hypothetical protein